MQCLKNTREQYGNFPQQLPIKEPFNEHRGRNAVAVVRRASKPVTKQTFFAEVLNRYVDTSLCELVATAREPLCVSKPQY